MTEHLCNSLGYSKQAYYKSLRSCNDKEERERYVLSIVEELRRDLPRLGVYKLWRMLNDNGLPVGLAFSFAPPSRLASKDEEVPCRHYRFARLAPPVPEPGERLLRGTCEPGMG